MQKTQERTINKVIHNRNYIRQTRAYFKNDKHYKSLIDPNDDFKTELL